MTRAALAVLVVAGCQGGGVAEPAPVPAPATVLPEVTLVAPSREGRTPYPVAPSADLEAARRVLGLVVQTWARDDGNPWAVAHGMLVEGPGMAMASGAPAVPTLFATYAVRADVGVDFPQKRGEIRIEPHADLLLKALTEAGLDPATEVEVAGAPATLADLYRHSLATSWVDGAETSYDSFNDTPWALQGLAAWAPSDLAWTADGHEMTMGGFTHALATKLSAETAFMRDAIAKGETVKKEKQGIFAYTCGGQHLIQGVAYAVARGFGTPEDREIVQTELGVLTWRVDVELGIVDGLLKAHPEYAVVLLDQRLKFLGHYVETSHRAAALGVWTPSDADRVTMDRAIAELVATVAAMNAMGVFARLDKVKEADEQTFLDLVGDSAHAARGIDSALGAGTIRYLGAHVDDAIAAAADTLAAGDPHGAARALAHAAFDPALPDRDDLIVSMVRTLHGIGRVLGLDALREAAEAELTPDGLYRLGYELIEVGLPGVAVPLLRRVNRDVPGQLAVVSELVAALERCDEPAAARDVALASPELLDDPWLRYMLVFCALSTGDLATARAYVGPLASVDGGLEVGVARVRAMLARADAHPPQDERDLRGWHHVLNGSLLLHISPYGVLEGMNGRYAFVQDSVGALRRDLDRLVAVIPRPERVLAVDERGSRIVAGAVGALLGVPVVPWTPDASGLTVVWDLAAVDPAVEAALRGPLFARAVCWTEPPSRVPDVVGLLHQTLTAPWGRHLVADPEEGSRWVEPSTEPDAVWISQILAAAPEASDPDHADPIDAVRALGVVAPSDLWVNGPVRSSRFL